MTELDVEALKAATDAVRARNMFTLDGAIAQGIREYLDRTSPHPAPQPSGSRILAPGSLDDETLERAAQVVDEHIGPNAISDEIRALSSARRALQEERG